ncbi:hypothetical protein SEA_CUMBERBATCH_31 [Streptomyces phage Cumberbatch]|uniref:Uncharacterized protein n=1 Tax=Streptomyces phage Cumberbatch TaxID=2736271 RepID=A0A6M9Z5C0_9CAUD|nr:hypothetical protein QEN65_gp31 [Streptomyces phage Cumberbatch]QKN87673.1 hypothetical protein SEA_CUMBERBATCH_31 [Streptomyces phage Cumberbatch]
MSQKAAATIAATAALIVVIGLTMQTTAYAITGAPYALGLAVTTIGFLTLAIVAPWLVAAIRTAAHDAAYLTYHADREYDRTVRTAPTPDRRTR